jgi:hypothetical protein
MNSSSILLPIGVATRISIERRAGPVPQRWLFKIRQSYRVNARLFKASIANLRVVICDNQQDLKQASGSYYVPFAKGLVTKQGAVVVRTPQFAEIDLDGFGRILTHEINHLFWLRTISSKGNLWHPLWLVEALALQTAQNRYVLSKQKLAQALRKLPANKRNSEQLLHFRFEKRRLASRQDLVILYSLWSHFSAYLFPNNLGRLVRLLQRAKPLTKARTQTLLERATGRPLEELFDSFLTDYLGISVQATGVQSPAKSKVQRRSPRSKFNRR